MRRLILAGFTGVLWLGISAAAASADDGSPAQPRPQPTGYAAVVDMVDDLFDADEDADVDDVDGFTDDGGQESDDGSSPGGAPAADPKNSPDGEQVSVISVPRQPVTAASLPAAVVPGPATETTAPDVDPTARPAVDPAAGRDPGGPAVVVPLPPDLEPGDPFQDPALPDAVVPDVVPDADSDPAPPAPDAAPDPAPPADPASPADPALPADPDGTPGPALPATTPDASPDGNPGETGEPGTETGGVGSDGAHADQHHPAGSAAPPSDEKSQEPPQLDAPAPVAAQPTAVAADHEDVQWRPPPSYYLAPQPVAARHMAGSAASSPADPTGRTPGTATTDDGGAPVPAPPKPSPWHGGTGLPAPEALPPASGSGSAVGSGHSAHGPGGVVEWMPGLLLPLPVTGADPICGPLQRGESAASADPGSSPD